jgi:uncharacterized repeat protein (TIGR01451 family)
VLHLPARSRWVCLLVIVLSIGFIVAWQNPPPLSLTVRVEPAVAFRGETVTFTFTIVNTGTEALEDLEVTVTVPEGTAFHRAAADNQQWDIDMAARTVRYRATGPFPAQASVDLALVVTVRQEAGQSIVLDAYEAMAVGFDEPVVGAPLTVSVEATAAQTPTATRIPATVTVTPTVTTTGTLPPETAAPAATETPPATPTPEPSPSTTATQTPAATQTPEATPTPEPTPTPTITVVVAELPPTPTPNLSTEQEVIGTITVLIFVGLVVAIIILVVVWVVRNVKNT